MNDRLIALLEALIEGQAIAYALSANADYTAQARQTLADARALLDDIRSGKKLLIAQLKADT